MTLKKKKFNVPTLNMYIYLVSEAVKHLLLEIGRNLYDGI